MDNPVITKKTVQYEQPVVSANNNCADVDDVINVLTVMTNSDRTTNFFSDEKRSATEYLKAAGLIEEKEPNAFAVKDMDGCVQLSNYLSQSMEDMISLVKSMPPVAFNNKEVEDK